jgi:hypothetical protein
MTQMTCRKFLELTGRGVVMLPLRINCLPEITSLTLRTDRH